MWPLASSEFESLYLAGGGLGQLFHKVEPPGVLVPRKAVLAVFQQVICQRFRGVSGVVQDHESLRFDQLIGIGTANNCGFQNQRVFDETTLNLYGRAPNYTYLKHVITATAIDEIAVLILEVGVAGVEPTIHHGLRCLLRVVPIVNRI